MITPASLLMTLFIGANAADEPDLRGLLLEHYRRVSAAMTARDIEALVSSGFRPFQAPEEDLRAAWQSSFKPVAAFGPVEFRLSEVTHDGNDVIAAVERSIVFRLEGDPSLHIEEGLSRERWSRLGATWRFSSRDTLSSTSGRILPPPGPESPRLRVLQEAVKGDPSRALQEFWSEVAGKVPLVEPLADDPRSLLVTFLWRDNGTTERVEVRGGPFETSREPFQRLAGTDVWFHVERLPRDARYVYGLVVRKRMCLPGPASGATTEVLAEVYPADPLNPLTFNGGPVVELPDAPRDTFHLEREGAAKGRVERHRIESRALGETRSVRVYIPPDGEGQAATAALAIFLDGEDAERLLSVPTALDNLLADGVIPPVVAVMVDSQGTRGRDLVFHDPFIEFLADELVPWAAERHQTRFPAERTVITGMSLGGLTAAYAAHRRPDVFGNVLSQSGAFWRRHPRHPDFPEGWLPGVAAQSSPAGVRYYLEVGLFEGPGMVENNRRLRDVLRARGDDVTYSEYHGGHDHVNWRVSLGRGLTALLRKRS